MAAPHSRALRPRRRTHRSAPRSPQPRRTPLSAPCRTRQPRTEPSPRCCGSGSTWRRIAPASSPSAAVVGCLGNRLRLREGRGLPVRRADHEPSRSQRTPGARPRSQTPCATSAPSECRTLGPRPASLPKVDTSWHGNPSQRISTGLTALRSMVVTSPRFGALGQWWAKTRARAHRSRRTRSSRR